MTCAAPASDRDGAEVPVAQREALDGIAGSVILLDEVVLDSGRGRRSQNRGEIQASLPDFLEVLDRDRLFVELELRVSAVQDLGPGGFDIVLANIDARTLVATIASLARAVASGGALLLSGLQPQDRQDITAVARRAGARIVETRYREEWMALLAKSGDQDNSVLH